MLAYSVSQRTREIGVRRALGALDKRILGMVLKQSLWQLTIGLSAGLILGLLFSYGLSRFWVLAEIFDPVMFFAVAILLTLVALVAAFVPAFRAIRVDPMEALRYE